MSFTTTLILVLIAVILTMGGLIYVFAKTIKAKKKEIKQIEPYNEVGTREIESLIIQAHKNHLNYVFVDRNLLPQSTIDDLRKNGYGVVIGQGEVSRIKITW